MFRPPSIPRLLRPSCFLPTMVIQTLTLRMRMPMSIKFINTSTHVYHSHSSTLTSLTPLTTHTTHSRHRTHAHHTTHTHTHSHLSYAQTHSTLTHSTTSQIHTLLSGVTLCNEGTGMFLLANSFKRPALCAFITSN